MAVVVQAISIHMTSKTCLRLYPVFFLLIPKWEYLYHSMQVLTSNVMKLAYMPVAIMLQNYYRWIMKKSSPYYVSNIIQSKVHSEQENYFILFSPSIEVQFKKNFLFILVKTHTMQFILHCVCSYLPRVASSWGNVAHATLYRNELRDSATNIKKRTEKVHQASELIEP